MITIGRINNPRAAQAFCDYMKTRQVKVIYEHREDQFVLLLERPEDEDFACAELRSFLSNPQDPKYLDASWSHGTTDRWFTFQGAGKGEGLKRFWRRAGLVTKSLVLISVAVTLLTAFGDYYPLTRLLMISDPAIWQGQLTEVFSGQIWRLLTPIFLHFMVLHILFNMMWLWDLGGKIERKESSFFLLFFVFSSGLISNLIQYFSSGPGFGGMSGVVYALLGYVWIRSEKTGSGYDLNSAIVTLMLIWLILGYTGILGPIGNAAHLSGLLIGVAYGFGINRYE